MKRKQKKPKISIQNSENAFNKKIRNFIDQALYRKNHRLSERVLLEVSWKKWAYCGHIHLAKRPLNGRCHLENQLLFLSLLKLLKIGKRIDYLASSGFAMKKNQFFSSDWPSKKPNIFGRDPLFTRKFFSRLHENRQRTKCGQDSFLKSLQYSWQS